MGEEVQLVALVPAAAVAAAATMAAAAAAAGTPLTGPALAVVAVRAM